MKYLKAIFLIASFSLPLIANAQSALTIEKIMQDPKTWVGTAPSNVFWSENGDRIYFNWNPEANISDSLYSITLDDHTPRKVALEERLTLPGRTDNYNADRSKKLYTRNGDIFMLDVASLEETQVTNTLTRESSVSFSPDGKEIIFRTGNNLFSWSIDGGNLTQLTNFKSGKKKVDKAKTEQNNWIADEHMRINKILSERKDTRDQREEAREKTQVERPFEIYTENKRLVHISVSTDKQYVIYTLVQTPKGVTQTIVPNYVTESGYTEDIAARNNVGSKQQKVEMWILDTHRDTTYKVKTKALPGIDVYPEYYSEYEKYKDLEVKSRPVDPGGPWWSKNRTKVLVSFNSKDHKDRWIALLNLEDGSSTVVDHQRDEAWIGGPGVGWFSSQEMGWMPGDKGVWYKSEASGYAHLYVYDLESKKSTALTSGKFEVYSPRISKDEKSWYFTANIEDPGIRHFYKMDLDGKNRIQLSTMEGNNNVILSPDESQMAILHSYANKPTELYLKEMGTKAHPKQITLSTTEAFRNYSWRVPEFVTFKARDNAEVHARLYKPKKAKKGGPAIIFVHGAGYLQNAHRWWSGYFREYMFHNFLTDQGYTVLDIDYRASSGYGRDWRTGIYRHMGGKDLDDQVDGAKYLVEKHKIDEDRIGIYGGSYGGFITLMALFNEPDVFAAGAALRSVTDWAHYNHGYTSRILNTPVEDSLAFVRSSPIYHAESLSKPLLICHGIIDTNVHFQDVVRLSQRLIELGKEDWEMAVYPLEGHGFREPSSWTDEYTRIYKLFEKYLKRSR